MKTRELEKTTHPGIYRRGNRYVVAYRDPSGRQRKQSAGTLAEARTLRATLTADVKRGEFRQLSRVKFVEYAPGWAKGYNGRTDRGVEDRTREDYAAALGVDPVTFEARSPARLAVKFFGRMYLTEIELRHVKEYTGELAAAGLAPGTVRKCVAPLKALLATALEDGLIRVNPTDGLRLSRRVQEDDGDEKVKALTEDELDAFLDVVDPVWRFFFEFLSQSGLRVSEAIELRVRRHRRRMGDGRAEVLPRQAGFAEGPQDTSDPADRGHGP
jgi:integrase